ncbi:MAG: DUF4198 domain-containing protein, partial [Desulfotignum sp.]|nr:DUF4198 domain-containing protein [Desulfotignum sp.]
MRTKIIAVSIITAAFMILAVNPALAHFGAIIPSDNIVTQDDEKTLNVQVKFIHPMELHYMEMARPNQFGVLHDGKKTDLLGTLAAVKGKSPDQDRKFTFWA